MRTLSHSLIVSALAGLLCATSAAAATGGVAAPSSSPSAGQRSPATSPVRSAPATPRRPAGRSAHVFPLLGSFTYPVDGQFGAGRSGHVHQGQDLSAAPGTAVVAPHAGTITTVAYQAAGAGYYVVLSGRGEQLDYVFMHLKAGSTRVHVGQTVKAGARIGDVGNTGQSSGPHLHFEIWVGAWQAGGKPVNPRPYLDRWRAAQGASRGRA